MYIIPICDLFFFDELFCALLAFTEMVFIPEIEIANQNCHWFLQFLTRRIGFQLAGSNFISVS